MVDTMMFRNSKNFIGDTAVEGLDELARVTVSNDNEAQDEVNFIFDFSPIRLLTVPFHVRITQMNHQIFEKHGMSNMSYEGNV